MSVTRRTALKSLAAAAATLASPTRAFGRERRGPLPDAVGLLYDSTRCTDCGLCTRSCRAQHGIHEPRAESTELSPIALTAVRKYPTRDGRWVFRKLQCMHCVDPGCVSACMLGAMRKGADGAVTWNSDLCVGCRYCEIACPFVVPRFEWDTPAPKLTKCDLCPDRRAQGLPPACVETCHRQALAYGRRAELLAEAHRRIAADPERYNPNVFGETEGGGTQVLLLAPAGVSFAEMGLPELGDESVAALPERIQHTLYKGLIAPVALFGLAAVAVRRSTRREGLLPGHAVVTPEPVGGRLLTWPFLGLAMVFLLGLLAVGRRFVLGLGPTTNLSDGYPMGLWIAFDVVTGTALACGGYAIALLVYALNKGRYHPLIRGAIATSALGYTLGGISVLIDIGRPWNFYKIPLLFWHWNVNSILLEVALCIMAYTVILWIELSPAFLVRFRGSRFDGLRKTAIWLAPRLEPVLPWVLALGLLLPTMHQSSLGSLMLLAGPKLHPLWRTPLLPLLFLISCVSMGYAAVVLESTISARAFGRKGETGMLRDLAGPISVVLLTFAALRIVDVVGRGLWSSVMELDRYSLLFMLEIALFTAPAVALLLRRRAAGSGLLVLVAGVVATAGALFRFSTYLFAFDPGPGWWYFPALGEVAVTAGILSAELMGYLFIVKRFPVLRGVVATPSKVFGRDATEDEPAVSR